MANTYVAIASTTLGSAQRVVTFSNIPQTYTDLVLRASIRNNATAVSADMWISVTSSSNTYGWTTLRGNGSTTSSTRNSGDSVVLGSNIITGSTATASTFSSLEIYIPNYTSSTTNKVVSVYGVTENNATSAWITAIAGLSVANDAVAQISISQVSTTLYDAGSTFHLYGISKN